MGVKLSAWVIFFSFVHFSVIAEETPEAILIEKIPGGMQVGRVIRIRGHTPENADRFTVNLQSGINFREDDIGLHVSVRFIQGAIIRNSLHSKKWDVEEISGGFPFKVGQKFELSILVGRDHYEISTNGQYFCDFPYRLPIENLTHLYIDGDVSISSVSWDL